MNRLCLLIPLLVFASALVAQAQELEPRRWTHLPTDSNFVGGGYAFTDGDLAFDPVIKIDDAEVEMHTVAFKYIRTFGLFGHSFRVDVADAYQNGTWTGTLNGEAAKADRSGMTDPMLQVAVNLYGGPPLKGKEYADYRAKMENETIVGAALAVHMPLGEYNNDKLINLGSNRFAIRPQLGVIHNRGKWGFELTGSAWIFTDNDDFFGGSKLEQDPLYAIQGHVVYTFRPGFWVAGGFAYGTGKESTVDGGSKDDERENIAFGCSTGYAITRHIGVKIGYLGVRSQADTGIDFDTFVAGTSFFW
jgi:hypothetical protein